MSYKTVLLFLLLALTSSIHAQSSFDQIKNEISLNKIDKISLPELDNSELRSEELKLRKKGRPDHFAKAQKVAINPLKDGKWNQSRNIAIWTYRITSKKAHSLNFGFDRYALPSSAKLLIYASDKSDIIGPFTVADNDVHKELWTPVIFGDDVIIELQVDANQKDLIDLHLFHKSTYWACAHCSCKGFNTLHSQVLN